MSMMSVLRGGNKERPTPVEPKLEDYKPKPLPKPGEEQHQLGSVTLQAVDQLTGMTADEIERLAEKVQQGADETITMLHELARRVRENGLYASERLANYVRTANACAENARQMAAQMDLRDQPFEEKQEEPAVAEPEVKPAATPPANLDEIEAAIAQHTGESESSR